MKSITDGMRFLFTASSNLLWNPIKVHTSYLSAPLVATKKTAVSLRRSLSIVNDANNDAARGSGTTARERRLLKVREEKRKREYDRLHNYPSWAK